MRPAAILMVAALSCGASALGACSRVEAPAVADVVRAVEPLVAGVQEENVRRLADSGLYEVVMGAGTGYVTPDGKYLISGELYEIGSRRNLTVERHDEIRRDLLAAMPEADAIVFGPEDPAHVVTVFTDVSCGFCRKLHSEVDSYASRGIAFRYYSYPREGPGSESWDIAEAVWCAGDRKDALSRAKLGERPERAERCDVGSVMRSYLAAGRFGIEGTPLLVLDDGSVVNGYVPADELLRIIQAHEAKGAGHNVAARSGS